MIRVMVKGGTCGPFEKKKGQDKVRGQREKIGAEVGVFKDMI